MKKIINLLTSILIGVSLHGQEQVFETKKAFLTPKNSRNESYAFSNQKTKDLLLLLAGKTYSQGILLDSLYQERYRITAKPLPKKFRHFIGYQIKNNIYSMLFSNLNLSKFGIVQFDINKKSYSEKFLDFKLKKEKFIESVIYDNEIFLFSITKRSSKLNIYKFDLDFKSTKHIISLEKAAYSNVKGSAIKKSVYTQLLGDSNINYGQYLTNVSKIEPQNPNVIEVTSKKIKIYPIKEKVVITFDDDHSKTDLISIDLKTLESSHTFFEKVSKDRQTYQRNNSYLFDNKLFQIASSKNQMNFRVIDLNTKEVVKEYNVSKKDSITFKNSPIIQEKRGRAAFGVPIDEVREMEKTAKFLRKISSSNLGISVYQTNDLYNIILGSTQEIDTQTGTNVAFGISGGFAGLVIANSFEINAPAYTNFNPIFYNYHGYNMTKSVYINCLFDENFNHTTGEIPVNSYDLINDFESTLQAPKAVNIFMHNNILHYNYLNQETGEFELIRFND